MTPTKRIIFVQAGNYAEACNRFRAVWVCGWEQRNLLCAASDTSRDQYAEYTANSRCSQSRARRVSVTRRQLSSFRPQSAAALLVVGTKSRASKNSLGDEPKLERISGLGSHRRARTQSRSVRLPARRVSLGLQPETPSRERRRATLVVCRPGSDRKGRRGSHRCDREPRCSREAMLTVDHRRRRHGSAAPACCESERLAERRVPRGNRAFRLHACDERFRER